VSLDFDWVRVPAGACTIGADACAPTDVNPDELPGGSLVLPAYLIARTPVTNQLYAAFVAASGHRPPGHWEGLRPPPALAYHPATYVDWHDARAFCAWAGVRLPSEAEWEKAARGMDGRLFPWGSAPPGPLYANCAGWLATTTPVGSCPAGASPYGTLDMAGNVWEWIASSYRAYPYRPDDGREDPTAPGRRVLRGGSFRSADDRYLRCAFRSMSYPTRRRDHIGFRVARTAAS
jgi:toxoflavin biosynthesis protein ToxD